MRCFFNLALVAWVLCIAACKRSAPETTQGEPRIDALITVGGPPDTKAAPSAFKATVQGNWKGTLADGGTVELKFNEQVVVVTISASGGGVAIGSMRYEIDANKSEAKIYGAATGPALVKPISDRALLLSGDFKIGSATYAVLDTRLERVTPGVALATKEKEPARPDAKTNGRPQVQAGQNSADKVYKSPAELFADMPKEAYPMFGPEGGIEQAAARKWMKKNLVGRTVEWTATVKELSITGDGPFTVRMWYTGFKDPLEVHATFHPEVPEGGLFCGFSFGGPFYLGSENCEVILGGVGIRGLSGLRVGYADCTAEEAAKLRKLKGSKVALRSKVTGAYVSSGKIWSAGEPKDRVPLALELSLPSVNGFLPQAGKADTEK